MTSGGDVEQGARQAAGFRLVLLVVLLVVALGSGGVLGYLLLSRSSGTDSQPERDEVMSVARQFMLAINTYGPKLLDDQNQMPEYRSSVSALITPKFQASFDQNVGIAEQTAKAGLTRSADVFSTGVSDLGPDSATVLVAGSFTNAYKNAKGKDVQDEPAPFRVTVSVIKVDGKWLVDDFTPVTGVDDSGAGTGSTGSGSSGTPSPSATPTGGTR